MTRWSEKKNPFKKDDRVWVDLGNIGIVKATVLGPSSNIAWIRVMLERSNVVETIHWRTCKLIKKKPRRGWWVSNSLFHEHIPKGMVDAKSFWAAWFERKDGPYVRTTKPEDITGWIYVEEKKIDE